MQRRHDALEAGDHFRGRHFAPDPPGAQQWAKSQVGPEGGGRRRQESSLRRQAAFGRPFRHLGVVKQQPPPVRCIRQPFVANPAFDDGLRNPKRFRNLDEIQIHGC